MDSSEGLVRDAVEDVGSPISVQLEIQHWEEY